MPIDSIIFDLDGTLTRVKSPWQHIHERLGVWENQANGFLQEWMSGQIGYEEFCRRDYALWGGHEIGEIEALLDEIELNRHVPDLVRRLIAERIPSIIISSGFSYVAQKIQREFSWEPLRIYANELISGPEVRLNVSADTNSPISKRRIAEAFLKESAVDPKRTLAVSDSERDLEMMSQCGYRILIEEEDDLLKIQSLFHTR